MTEEYDVITIRNPRILLDWFAEVGKDVSAMYGDRFEWHKFDIYRYAELGRITVCLKMGKPVGVMLARLYSSIFDNKTQILFQDLLYAKPGTRAAYYLLENFLDFGKANADHVITVIGEKSNIKGTSLEKKGFIKLDELYRFEVKRG